jgi:hypothetical protein
MNRRRYGRVAPLVPSSHLHGFPLGLGLLIPHSSPMKRCVQVLVVGLVAMSAAVLTVGGPAGAATSTPAVQPTPAVSMSLPAPTTTATAAQRHASSARFTIGTWDKILPTGQLAWLPNSGVPFDTDYGYATGTGPGTKSDAHSATLLAFAQRAQLLGAMPVITYFRMNGNYWGSTSNPAACLATCTQGDTAKRNLDHLNDPSFMQNYFTGLVDTLRTFDTSYTGQAVLHVEPDLSAYGQMLSLDRARCATDCVNGVGPDNPAGVRAAVASSGIKDLSGFPNTMQGFYSAVLYLRDRYAPRVSLAYHVSNWATARTGTVTGNNDVSNNITSSTVAVDAAALGQRVASFAALNGASTTDVTRPGPKTSRYDLLFNDVLDADAAYYSTVRGTDGYWWDTENIDLPNFARWETYLGAITAATGLSANVWQVPLGNTIYKVENNTTGHYQDNKLQYFFDHLPELKAIGVTGVMFGSGYTSTNPGDSQNDLPDNSTTVCTTLGSHSQTPQCPTLSASLTDDDGGYFRQRALTYFLNPLPLS